MRRRIQLVFGSALTELVGCPPELAMVDLTALRDHAVVLEGPTGISLDLPTGRCEVIVGPQGGVALTTPAGRSILVRLEQLDSLAGYTVTSLPGDPLRRSFRAFFA